MMDVQYKILICEIINRIARLSITNVNFIGQKIFEFKIKIRTAGFKENKL